MPRNSVNASLFVYIKSSSASFVALVLLLATPALAYASRSFDLGIALVPTVTGEASRSVREAQPTPSLVAVTQPETSRPITWQIEVPGCITRAIDTRGPAPQQLCVFQRFQFPGMLVDQLACNDPKHLVDPLAVFRTDFVAAVPYSLATPEPARSITLRTRQHMSPVYA
jgi:hypothetical protein